MWPANPTMTCFIAAGYYATANCGAGWQPAEIHIELWVSLRSFDGRCSSRTWLYRISHNVGASHVVRSRRLASRLVDLETLEGGIPAVYAKAQPDYRFSAAILLNLIRRLRPLGRQFILLYLKGEGSETIADVTGLSAANIVGYAPWRARGRNS